MRGVADKNDLVCVPSIQGDPINRGAVDLFVALDGCEILLDDPAKSGKVATQPGEPADHRLVSSRRCQIAKPVGPTVADWA
jgi:hypothetical protein